MATYVNDLRLKEITTGDEAGTWGTSTNTNLKLIGEALGYGTENCFAANINTTVTVADGASDNLRAMYFKATSSATLTATRTLTIAPNTMSRVMLIENATTGGQSIEISQGSGANVTIPNGQTKMVYLDGAGSGAAVVDAFADFSLPTVTVADLTATTADINGGTIDGATLGGSSQVTITDADMNGGTIDGVTIGGSSAGPITGTTGQFNTSLTIASPGGSSARFVYTNNDQGNLRLRLENNGSGGNTWELVGGQVGANNADFTIYDATNTAKRALFSNNGDISFYEDTGTTAKFFWDASAEALGIGTSSPASKLSVASGDILLDNTRSIIFKDSNGDARGVLQYYSDNSTYLDAPNGSTIFRNGASNTEKMRITLGGNVGIGTDSPSAFSGYTTLSLNNATNGAIVNLLVNGTETGRMQAFSGAFNVAAKGASTNLTFETNGSERMRIASDGNVGLGTSAPKNWLWPNSSTGALELQAGAALSAYNNSTYLSQNWYYNSGEKYIASGYATRYEQNKSSGNHAWYIAGSGSADGAVSWTQAMTLNASGNVGIGTSSPGNKLTVEQGRSYNQSADVSISVGGSDNGFVDNGKTSAWRFNVTGNAANGQSLGFEGFLRAGTWTERMRIDSSGNVGIGVTPTAKLHVGGTIQAQTGSSVAQMYSDGGAAFFTSVGAYPSIFSTNGTERARFDTSGNFFVASTSNPYSFTNAIIAKTIASEGATRSYVIRQVSNEGWNVANATIWAGRDGTNNRSINAGGTLNASGADYAEYMTKAGDFTIAKGDICGIDSNGKLTNVWADAISFVVKSTDPSYVGGDSWGAGLDEAEMEVARQTVDRIAFSGQVPVNVYGAAPGDYIVPSQDGAGISGIAVSNPTFEQYMQAVGKVIAIESDGRAKIIVKNI